MIVDSAERQRRAARTRGPRALAAQRWLVVATNMFPQGTDEPDPPAVIDVQTPLAGKAGPAKGRRQER